MKKIISLLLAILMLCSLLAGCKKKASISDAALAAKEELEADDAEPGSIGDYDPGEVGFKAQSEVYSNASTCISAAQELLF